MSSMHFHTHSELAGRHSFLSASKYHWINYDAEKMSRVFVSELAKQRGTELHEYASTAIRLGRRQPKNNETVNKYINDALGFRMTPELILFYSLNAFGTADTISFRLDPKTGIWVLRIHDLKTGVTPTSMHQLEIYAAYFCLEYGFKPAEIEIHLRIYQNDEVNEYDPDPMDITNIMDKIVTFDKLLDALREEEF